MTPSPNNGLQQRRWQQILSIVLGAMVGPLGQLETQERSDFEQYVEEIRGWGMTESARQSLQTISLIRLGGTLLTVQQTPEDSSLGRTYRSTSCPIPGADLEQVRAWQQQLQEELRHDLDVLRQYADTDGSGFVSTREGLEFRELIEFGYLAEAIRRDYDGSLGALSDVTQVLREKLRERALAYERVAVALNAGTEVVMPRGDWILSMTGDQ